MLASAVSHEKHCRPQAFRIVALPSRRLHSAKPGADEAKAVQAAVMQLHFFAAAYAHGIAVAQPHNCVNLS